MTSHLLYAASLALFGFIGLLLGAAQLVSLNENVRLYTSGRSRGAAAAFHVARLVLAGVAWLAVARFGRAPGLLGAFAGFLVSRPIVTTWLGRTRS
jgi:hypothetical protein